MDLTRDYIDGLSFTVKKDKYYLGNEVDEALDNIAAGVDDLHRQLGEYRMREEKMKSISDYGQNQLIWGNIREHRSGVRG